MAFLKHCWSVNKLETVIFIWDVVCRLLSFKTKIIITVSFWSRGISLLRRKFKVFMMRKNDSIYKERRLLQRSFKKLPASGVLLSLETKSSQTKKSTKRPSNPPPKQKSPRTVSAALCNQSDSVMQGGEESKSERTVNKSWEGRECHPVCWVVAGFCCVSFYRVLLITTWRRSFQDLGKFCWGKPGRERV